MALQSINPATGELLQEYDALSESELEAKLQLATEAFEQWRTASFAQRSEMMYQAAEVLRSKKQQWGEVMTREMGKPISGARAEAEKCAWVCDYYAEHAVEFLQDDVIGTDADRSYIRYEPLGPVLAVMPWNYPFWQVFRFAAPGLMAGDVGLLKHASNVPGCALAIEQIFTEAGFPEGVFQTLLIGSGPVSGIIGDARVKAVTLTGSEFAGKKVAEAAGRALKKSVLELGGSDPFIILDDADIERAAQVGAGARCLNSGQSCIAAKRFIVLQDRLKEFTEAFVPLMAGQKLGDPMDENTQIGPQAREDLRDDLHRQVTGSVDKGAKILTGGEPSDRDGYYYPPTVLTDVGPGMPAFEEEVFGPVAAIVPVDDEVGAIRVANDTEYGLGASLWSRDIGKAERLTREIQAGCVFVNGLVKSDPRLPFGGVKQSGYGRELGSHGIREFVNVKTMWMRGR